MKDYLDELKEFSIDLLIVAFLVAIGYFMYMYIFMYVYIYN